MLVTAQHIIESIPSRFRPEKARGLGLVFHFEISGETQDTRLDATIIIKEGVCTMHSGLVDTPDCVLTADAETYVTLETGKLDAQSAFMEGKVKVSNIAAMMQFAKCFRKFETQDTRRKTQDESNQQAAVSSEPVGQAGHKSAIKNQKAVAKALQSKTNIQKSGPLKGVKIVDFTRLLPGPLATMFLADLGADVIKIEDPDSPDYIRGFEPRVGGESMYYLSLNRNKRSLAVNYLSPEGRQTIYNLIKTADVLVEQFRPGVMKQWGLDYTSLLQHNTKLIYVALTGYGQNSSLAAVAGHDINYIAKAGALGITYDDDGHPVIPGFQLGDVAGGSYMVMNAVMAALYQREKTGKGDFVDVAMTDGVLPFTIMQFARHQAENNFAKKGKFELSGGLANYNVYKCSDGKFIVLGSLEPKFWRGFCLKAAKPEWADGFLWKGEQLKKLKLDVKTFFLTKTAAQWVEEFKNEDICLTAVNGLEDLGSDIYLNERKMFVESEHPGIGKYKTINQPLKFTQTEFANNRHAPALGEDSHDILKELGYTDEKIFDLEKNNIVKL